MVELGKVSEKPWPGAGRQAYITYRQHEGIRYSPTEWDPPTYSGIAVFIDEVEGLRYANAHSLKLIPIDNGETLEAAIKRAPGA